MEDYEKNTEINEIWKGKQEFEWILYLNDSNICCYRRVGDKE